MYRIGSIITSEICRPEYNPYFLENPIMRKIINFFTATFKDNEYQWVHINDMDLELYIGKLPFTSKQLDLVRPAHIDRLCKKIIDYFHENEIKNVVLPRSIKRNKYIRENMQKNNFLFCDGQYILLAMSLDILKKLCKIMNTDVAQLDIGIVENTFTNRSRYLIQVLSRHVKYFALITKCHEEAQKYLDHIFEETGLTGRVSMDAAKTAKNLTILFVLDDLDAFLKQVTLHSQTIILNFGGGSTRYKYMDHIIIDDIIIKTPEIVKPLIKVLGPLDEIELIGNMVLQKL